MKRFSFRFLTLLLCMVTLLCLFPMTASAEEIAPEKAILVTEDHTHVTVDAPAATYSARATLGTPTELKWNTIRDWTSEPPTLAKKYGSITWRANEPYSTDITWFRVKVYRDGKLIGGHTVGWDTYYLSNYDNLVDFDLTSPVQWETGSYYFTVQAITDPNCDWGDEVGSNVVKSGNWNYTKPSAKLAAPKNLKWDFPYCTWTAPAGHEDNYHVEMYYSETANGEKYHFHSEWNIHGTQNSPPSWAMEEGFSRGYYHVRVRSLSNDITKTQCSNWSNFVTYYYPGTTLEAPTVYGSLSGTKAVIKWAAVDNAAKYQVYRSNDYYGDYTRLITTTKLSCTNTPAPGTYYYKVRALEADGTAGPFSDVIEITVPETCAAPAVWGSLSGTKAVINWDYVPNAAKYQVYRSTSENGTYTRLITTVNLKCTNTPAPGTYYYKVRALDAAGNPGPFSNVVEITVPEVCAAPVVRGSLSGKKAITTWDAVPNAAKYQVYRSTSENSGYTRLLTTVNLKCTNTPAPGTYYYKVRALDAAGNAGSFSNVVKITVPDATCAAPVVSGSLSGTKAITTWGAVNNAVKYEVYRSTNATSGYKRLLTTVNLKCTNTPAPGTYFYKVRALDANGVAGPYSNVVEITVPAASACAAPVVEGSLSGSKAITTWNAVDNAEQYEVYRATSQNGTYRKLLTTVNLKCTNTPAPGTYFYKVRALDANGVPGPFSNIVELTVE